MAQARKVINVEKEGDYETQRSHVEYFEIDEGWLDSVWEEQCDDPESAYHNGLGGDMDGELFFINVDTFLAFCKRELEQLTDDEDDEASKNMFKYFIKSLGKYKGYTIYPYRSAEKQSLTKVGGKNGRF